MSFDKYVELVVSGIKECAPDLKLIFAYPDTFKPTRLDEPVVAISVGGADMKNIELGGDTMAGDVIVKAEIFVPLKLGAEVLQSVLRDVAVGGSACGVSGIAVGAVESAPRLDALRVACRFTFSDEIIRGDDSE